MNTKLIALAAIAAGAFAGVTADIAEGAPFEVTADQAEPILTAGVAKLAEPAQSPPKAKMVQARVLVDCAVGKIDEVVTLDAAEAKNLAAAGQIDTHKDAVAYAKSLAKD
jgi:hypothetical protein